MIQKEDLYELINLKVDQSNSYQTSHAKLGKLDQAMTGKGYIDRNPDGKVDRTIIYPDGKIDQT